MGRVVADGPDTKLATTRSSSDNVKASSQPETSAGLIPGRVTRHNTPNGRAPRSSAASSSARSKPVSCARTNTATKQQPNVAWAMVTVTRPRLAGQPSQACDATNNKSSDRPRITSGTTSGAISIKLNTARPRNRLKRAIANPAQVPSTSATVAASTA